jgi:hypothetical protein
MGRISGLKFISFAPLMPLPGTGSSNEHLQQPDADSNADAKADNHCS